MMTPMSTMDAELMIQGYFAEKGISFESAMPINEGGQRVVLVFGHKNGQRHMFKYDPDGQLYYRNVEKSKWIKIIRGGVDG